MHSSQRRKKPDGTARARNKSCTDSSVEMRECALHTFVPFKTEKVVVWKIKRTIYSCNKR